MSIDVARLGAAAQAQVHEQATTAPPRRQWSSARAVWVCIPCGQLVTGPTGARCQHVTDGYDGRGRPLPIGCFKRFPSQLQGRVWSRILTEMKPGDQLALDTIWPLPILGPDERGRLTTIEVDFFQSRKWGGLLSKEMRNTGWQAWDASRIGTIAVRVIDAKQKGRVHRDWPARAKAFRQSYGVAIEEVSS